MPTASRTKLWLQLQSRDQRERCLSSTLNDRPTSLFLRLVRHFLDRLVPVGNDAASTEFELGIGALLGLLAAPGAFTCLLLLDKYSTLFNWLRGRLREDLYVASLPDKYLFLSLAMAVTG